MKHTTPLTLSALLTSLILAACATSQPPPPALVEARSTVRSAELDAAVQAQAPMELKKATDSLSRANSLLEKGEPMADVNSAAYIASQQAKTAMAIAQAKGADAAMSTAELERERARSDMRAAEAQRARMQTGAARQQAAAAEQRASGAEQRAAGAEQQAVVAQAAASDAQQQAAQLRQRLDELQAKQTERGQLVTLGDVLFESGRAEVKPGAQASLTKLGDFLKQYPTRHILIEGHTDNVGTASYNETLSQRRAAAVASALLTMGVPANRVTTAGYGKDYPVAANNSDTNRALNRRVEVYIADNDMPVKSRR